MRDDRLDKLVLGLLSRKLAARGGDIRSAVGDRLDAGRGTKTAHEHVRARVGLEILGSHLSDGKHRGGTRDGQRLGGGGIRATRERERAHKGEHCRYER